jgi:hypothetical protein
MSRHAVYSLPVARKSIRGIFKFIELYLAKHEWPIGAVYFLRAKKEREATIKSKRSTLSRLTGVRPSLKPVSGVRQRPAISATRKVDY